MTIGQISPRATRSNVSTISERVTYRLPSKALLLQQHVERRHLERSSRRRRASPDGRGGRAPWRRPRTSSGDRDVIDGDIDTAAAGEIEQRFCTRRASSIDHLVSTRFAAGIELVGGNVDCDHLGMRPLRHHQLMDADATAGAEDCDGLARS